MKHRLSMVLLVQVLSPSKFLNFALLVREQSDSQEAFVFENSEIKAVFNKQGDLVSLWDKKLK